MPAVSTFKGIPTSRSYDKLALSIHEACSVRNMLGVLIFGMFRTEHARSFVFWYVPYGTFRSLEN